MSSKKKLNILQRGILQKAVTVVAYLGSIAVGTYILDWADKRIFSATITEATQRGIISPDAAIGLQRFIDGRDGTVIFAIVLTGLFCVVLGWLFMCWASKRNWSWPVTLAQVVEFRFAMRKLGITAPEEEIAFVKKHKIPVFIALKPLLGNEQEKVSAKLYAFAHHSSFSESEIFERHIGKQTLCLDTDDYEHLLKEHGRKTESAYSAKIVELEHTITDLKAAHSIQYSDIATLTEINEELLTKNAEHRQRLQTAPGREKKSETSNIRRIPFWRVAGPLINRLIEKAKPDAPYTRSDIQAAFDVEVAKFPDLKAAIKAELHAAKQKEPESEFDLTGWGMDSIRAGLGDYAKKEPGATKK